MIRNFETLEYHQQGQVAEIRLNRPEKLNALNWRMVHELRDGLEFVSEQTAVRALLVTGSSRAFSAGADLSELAGMRSPVEFFRFAEAIQATFTLLETLHQPAIAAIRGLAYGGGLELALACDLRIMAEDATIGVPEIKVGTIPGAGGTQRIPRTVPVAIAKAMLYLGEPLPAELALRYGLVNEIVPSDQVEEVARRLAVRLTELPPLAISAAKALVHTALNADLQSGLYAEKQASLFLFGTDDRREGMDAFVEKRKASFAGH